MLQVEYHYFHGSNITVPRKMLEVLKGLTARDMRVFNVEPNYWWKNWAHEFMEFAYIQVILPVTFILTHQSMTPAAVIVAKAILPIVRKDQCTR